MKLAMATRPARLPGCGFGAAVRLQRWLAPRLGEPAQRAEINYTGAHLWSVHVGAGVASHDVLTHADAPCKARSVTGDLDVPACLVFDFRWPRFGSTPLSGACVCAESRTCRLAGLYVRCSAAAGAFGAVPAVGVPVLLLNSAHEVAQPCPAAPITAA